jgi:DNA-binding transcriptional ArsR family regulator
MNSYVMNIIPATETDEGLNINQLEIKKAVIQLRAINHKLRQIMLQYIGQHERINVTEIFNHLLLEQSVASQHLAVLRKAGFVKTKREGKNIYYSVNRQRVLNLNRFISDLLA